MLVGSYPCAGEVQDIKEHTKTLPTTPFSPLKMCILDIQCTFLEHLPPLTPNLL